ncbi:helix-turn-helix transcriptional regulator [Halomarina pelagica]|uniref:helix-turn-helix transcriptional regulator n=1 Tax=Halomarina pelagica TaxID=2961599 RepID=UPI0020C4EDBA|nr:MarR family transcriptional regulator [Halomarina sp. BND7]
MAALDDVAFLARSPSRVAVLETLTEGAHSRAALQEVTGVPRATVGRIVTELEARGLVTRRGADYRASPLGELLAREFLSLVDTAVTVDKLRRVSEWLPIEAFEFDLDRLVDAEITLADRTDIIAPIRRAVELFETGDRVRILAPVFVRESPRAIWQATVHGDQTSEITVTAAVLEVMLADPECAMWLRELAASDRGSVARYDGSISYALAVVDDIAWIGLLDEDGAPRGLLETTDEIVHAWAEATIDDHWQASNPLEPDDPQL